MMKIDYTNEMVFGFDGPNLCLLGTEKDFLQLAQTIVDLTSYQSNTEIEITKLNFIEVSGDPITLLFSSKRNSDKFGVFNESSILRFELDSKYWERIFKYFVFMSWEKRTYYLNSFEDALRDLPLEQECHLICSSEF
jgi:hypothetical protein